MPGRARLREDALDVAAVGVVEYRVLDDPLLSLDALADAAERLPPRCVEHHLGDLPFVLPEGDSVRLDRPPGEVVRGVAANGCWVMLRSLATLPEYEALLRRVAARFALALHVRGDDPVAYDLVAFVGAPGATVPVHFDRNHHLLVQVQGTKTVGTGSFRDPRQQQRQLERGLQAYRLNADALPDERTEHVVHPGEGILIPAFTFHWVRGHDDVSVALTCVVTTEATRRTAAVHEFNSRARRFGLSLSPPGRNARSDRAKEKLVHAAAHVRRKVA